VPVQACNGSHCAGLMNEEMDNGQHRWTYIWQRGRPYLTVMLGTIYCKSTISTMDNLLHRKVDGKN